MFAFFPSLIQRHVQSSSGGLFWHFGTALVGVKRKTWLLNLESRRCKNVALTSSSHVFAQRIGAKMKACQRYSLPSANRRRYRIIESKKRGFSTLSRDVIKTFVGVALLHRRVAMFFDLDKSRRYQNTKIGGKMKACQTYSQPSANRRKDAGWWAQKNV